MRDAAQSPARLCAVVLYQPKKRGRARERSTWIFARARMRRLCAIVYGGKKKVKRERSFWDCYMMDCFLFFFGSGRVAFNVG